MVFSSFTFLILFLPAVCLLHFLSRNPIWRNMVLTLFSLLFYAWGEPRLVLLMLLSITVNYACALGMEKSRGAVRRLLLAAGVCISLGMLIYYKYAAFFGNSVLSLLGKPAVIPTLVLPIGISFYTFQILTYTIDVYRGKVPAQHSYLKLALYISFFPQLIAGPIVNYTYVEPQLTRREILPEQVYRGVCRFFVGLAKKVLLANMLGKLLEELTLTGTVSVLAAWLGAIAFALQIYFDFSGYSDMAIGLGGIFGFRFPENFRAPYAADSITDFWRRWHISLGAFFREYVYIPLGGNRAGLAHSLLNLLVVWALTGLWHGASWNFVVWGAYYGLLLILEKYCFRRLQAMLPTPLKHMLTLLLVLFGWVLFYHESLGDGVRQLLAMFGIGSSGAADASAIYALKEYLWILIPAMIACIPFGSKQRGGRFRRQTVPVVEAAAVSLLFVLSLIFLAGSGFNPFLYFRF